MTPLSTGDLARSLAARMQNARLRTDLDRLTAELSSGRVADPVARLRGDLAPLAAVEGSLTRLDSQRTALAETRTLFDTAQAALESIAAPARDLAGRLLAVRLPGDPTAVDAVGVEARHRFEAVVGALNASAAGRSVFAGTATDGPALADAAGMLAALSTATAGLTSPADLADAVDAWFAPGGAFDSAGYTGGADALAPARLPDGGTAPMPVKADDPALRKALAALATGSLLAEGALAGDPAGRSALAGLAGTALVAASDGVVALQAELGATQERIDEAETTRAAKVTALTIARNDLVGADPFDTASQLQATQTQLETFYALTARLSQLSLTRYL